jgi:putative salt-induced outer membrane protein YdiY
MMLASSTRADAKRNDLVIMKNGDRLTGEVKKLEGGVLYVDLDYVSGSVGLDWTKVEKVNSTGTYQVVMESGARMAGTIAKTPEKEAPGKDFQVQTVTGPTESPAAKVVEIQSQKQNFWRQLTGSIDLGYSFSSGNSETQLNSDASVNYLTTRWTLSNSYNASFNGQPGSSKTNLLEVQSLDGIFLNRNSSLLLVTDFLHSTQQQLDLRSTFGGAYGGYFIRSNKTEFGWLGGSVYTHENFSSAASRPSDQNIEALAGIYYQQFHFDRYSINAQLLVYPGLSDYGRVRATGKTSLTVKLSNNFHTDFSFWDNYDSEPPTTAKKNELGISNNIGYTF